MPVEAYCRLHGRFADRLSSRMPLEAEPKVGRRPANRGCPLPQYLKIALLAAAILIALCMRSDAQEALSAAAIEDRIIGHAFQGRKGILSVSLQYGTDGAVTMRSPLGTGTGRWTLSGDQLCVKMETGLKKVNECLTFTRQTDGVYRASNGLRLTPVE
ncbi:hypothetical protein I5535_16250 [Rhodobacteraceae bacterium F11138]|nr:hypothetical protein [Rhodobacteraceae bacterium F11138]